MQVKTITINEKRDVTLTCYLLGTGGEFRNAPKRPAMLVIPGGGYEFCSDREADPVAMQYLKAGFQTFILRYSVGKHKAWPNPLDDYEKAMTLIREKADDWGIYPDKIAVVGFSAGGHLASAAATAAKNRPNAAILGYAVLIGKYVWECSSSAPDTVKLVDSTTCPCFLFATRDDMLVPVINTLKFAEALDEAGVGFELHIYAYGDHGSSTCDPSITDGPIAPRAQEWVPDSIEWLGDIFGKFSPGGLTDPVIGTYVNGDFEDTLSIDCTIGYLMKQEAAMSILGPVIDKIRRGAAALATAQAGGFPTDSIIDSFELTGRIKLRSMLEFGHVPEREVIELQETLRKIPNKR